MSEFLHLEYDGYYNKPDVGPEYRMLFEEAHYSLMLAVGIKVIGRDRGELAYITREDALDLARAIIDRWGEKPALQWPNGEVNVPAAEPLRAEGLDGSKPIEIGPDGFVRQAVARKPDGEGWVSLDDPGASIAVRKDDWILEFWQDGVFWTESIGDLYHRKDWRGVWARPRIRS